MKENEEQYPLARRDRLVVHELPDEVLVYDLDRHRAHSLNRTAAWVWRHCDGTTSPKEMAARWESDLNLPADEELVRLALGRLARVRLLQGALAPKLTANPSRRILLRGAALAGGMALVSSVSAPDALAAGSPCGACNLTLHCCCVCSGGNNPGVNCGSFTCSGTGNGTCSHQCGVGGGTVSSCKGTC